MSRCWCGPPGCSTPKNAAEWIPAGGLKSLMLRLQPSFDEAESGHRTFTQFLRSHDDVVDVRNADTGTMVHLRELGPVELARSTSPVD